VRLAIASLLFLCVSCGGSKTKTDTPPTVASADPAPASAPSESATAAPADAPPAAPAMPTKCAQQGDVCTPPSDFVTRLCNKNFLEATMVLYQKDSPWTRMYLKGDVVAWFPDGASLKAKLLFDEEVLVLRKRVQPKGGMVIGDGSGSYDVLRWDGNCYALEAGQLTSKLPPNARRPVIDFYKLGKRMQDALLKDKAVTAAYAKRQKECAGATMGDVSAACEKAVAALSNATIEFVRTTGGLPEPEKIP